MLSLLGIPALAHKVIAVTMTSVVGVGHGVVRVHPNLTRFIPHIVFGFSP